MLTCMLALHGFAFPRNRTPWLIDWLIELVIYFVKIMFLNYILILEIFDKNIN